MTIRLLAGVLTLGVAAGAARADEPGFGTKNETPPAETPPAEPPPAEPTPAETPPGEPTPPPRAPTPKQAAEQAEGQGDGQGDPRARPHFIKGELSGGQHVRPLGVRSFVGAGMGMSALPSSAGTALNAFFLTIEPQVDLRFPKRRDLKIGLGVPLNFQIVDSRAAFERCVGVARMAYDQSGGDQMVVDAATAACVEMEADKATEELGALRERDWDEPSDFAKVIRYVTVGGDEQPFFLNVSRLFGQSIGHGTVVRRYNPNVDYDTTRVGVTFDGYHRFVGVESMVNDVLDPDVFGVLAFVRPLEPFFPDTPMLKSLSFGAQLTVGLDVPRALRHEERIWAPMPGAPIPALDADGDFTALETDSVVFIGVDAETKIVRTDTADVKLYVDAQQLRGHGRGYTFGSLMRFSFGQPATSATRVRVEGTLADADYLPSFFDSFYDVHKLQYGPAAYQSGMSVAAPTKLAFVEAMQGGPRRLGGYLEITHSFLGALTVGLSVRGSKAFGDPVDPGFAGPSFDDVSACAVVAADGALDCAGTTPIVVDPGWSSTLVFLELPFRQFLQGFVSYEAFATGLDGEGLDLGQFDGDNEVLFAGARMQILPILFLQGEARRYFFAQRLSKIDVDAGVIEQDQNLRADWTFSISVYAGLEF